jgi:hypothetical protein
MDMGKLNSNEKDIDFINDNVVSDNQKFEQQVESAYDIASDESFDRVNIKKYKDPEGMTLEKMKVGFWMIRNQGYFYSLVIGLLILFAFSGWFVFFFVFGQYSIFGSRNDNLMVVNSLNNTLPDHNFFISRAARDLGSGESGFLRNENGSYDFYARITNPNQNHWTKFNYHFIYGNERSRPESGYILPGKSKYILILNQESPRGISLKPQLKIENINWMRVNPHQFKDWRSYKAEYLNIDMSNDELVRSQNTNLSEKLPLNELKFTAQNKTAYNYHKTDFVIILKSGDNIEGVNKYTADNFNSGEIRQFNFVWPGNFGRINDIYIEPQINVFDKDNFIRFK